MAARRLPFLRSHQLSQQPFDLIWVENQGSSVQDQPTRRAIARDEAHLALLPRASRAERASSDRSGCRADPDCSSWPVRRPCCRRRRARREETAGTLDTCRRLAARRRCARRPGHQDAAEPHGMCTTSQGEHPLQQATSPRLSPGLRVCRPVVTIHRNPMTIMSTSTSTTTSSTASPCSTCV
jgi:hypothetical protein